jgi:hypothetical protein
MIMMSEEKINWEESIERILKTVEAKPEQFRKKKAFSSVHSIVLEEIRNEWNKYHPTFEEKTQLIDFVGRTFPRHGRIELAVEIDTWHKRADSWVKLLDINASNKFWIYLCRDKERSEEFFNEAVKGFRELAKLRREDKTNNVTIFMKVAGGDVKKTYLFE